MDPPTDDRWVSATQATAFTNTFLRTDSVQAAF